MSFQANRRQSQPDEAGYALPIVIVVIAVGALAAVALLGYAAALLRAGEDDADSLLHLYAADAGITKMKEWHRDGNTDADMEFMFYGVEVKVKSSTPTPTTSTAPIQDIPSSTSQSTGPISPKLPNPLENEHNVRIKSIPPGSVLDVRWEYSTTTDPEMSSTYTSPSIRVEAEGTPIATSEPCTDYLQDDDSQGCLQVRSSEGLGAGELSIIFYPGTEENVLTQQVYSRCPNGNSRTLCVIPAPSAVGNPQGIELNAGQALFYLHGLPTYYTVVSEAGDMTVTAYISQIPGFCPDDSSDDGSVSYKRCDRVETLSWKPYRPDPPESNDGDESDEPSR